MKLVNYRCVECAHDQEEIFNDSEDEPEVWVEPCQCGGRLEKFNFKNNEHRVFIEDRSGL